MLFDTLTVSAFTTLAKVMGAAKAVVLARAFGSGAALDSYLLAFLLPSFLADVFCGSLVPVLVPKLVEFEYLEGRAKAVDLYGHVLRRSVWLSCGAAAALAVGAAVVAMLGAGSARLEPSAAGHFDLLMTPILPLAAVANVWRAVLNSQRSFVVPAFTVTLDARCNHSVYSARRRKSGHLASGGRNKPRFSCGGRWFSAWGFEAPDFRFCLSGGDAILSLIVVRKEYVYLAAVTAMSAGTAVHRTVDGSGAGSRKCVDSQLWDASGRRADGDRSGGARVSRFFRRFSYMVAARDWEQAETITVADSFGIGAGGRSRRSPPDRVFYSHRAAHSATGRVHRRGYPRRGIRASLLAASVAVYCRNHNSDARPFGIEGKSRTASVFDAWQLS